MTVDELIVKLTMVSTSGHGAAAVLVEEVGEGFFGTIENVDTLMVHPSGDTLTLTAVSEID